MVFFFFFSIKLWENNSTLQGLDVEVKYWLSHRGMASQGPMEADSPKQRRSFDSTRCYVRM